MSTWKSQVSIAIAAAFLGASFTFSASANQWHGRIFLSDQGGNRVCGDHFNNACDVYINASLGSCFDDSDDDCDNPSSCHNSHHWHGFRDGEYYFQVTDPSGHNLLSTDDIEQRRIRIEDGFIVENLGNSAACVHALGLGDRNNTGDIGVELMPFAPAPNGHNVYKAWITQVCDYDPEDCNSVFGFKHSRSKTDNFKCPPPYNQPPPPPPPPVDPPHGPPSDPPNDPPSDPPVDPVALRCTIIMNGYYDANASGSNDGDQPLNDLRFNITYQAPGATELTEVAFAGDQALGQASLDIPAGSTVMVWEDLPLAIQPSHWLQTEPNLDSTNATLINNQWVYTFTAPDDVDSVFTLMFGNVSLYTPHGGRPIKYWSTSAGRRILLSHDSAWRGKLDNTQIRCANGKAYNIPSGDFEGAYSDFCHWIRDAGSSNMACRLSIQFASVRLTTLYGHLSPATRVYVSDNAVDTLGLAGNAVSINKLIYLTRRTLGQNGLTIVASPTRSLQQVLMGNLKAINNNKLWFVHRDAPAVVY